jgi:Late embryogenesis abundant protein
MVRGLELIGLGCALSFVSSCATLEGLRGVVQAPIFSQSDEHAAEIRMIGPTAELPVGGAAVRIWTVVANPNPFGFTLRTLRGTLFLEGTRSADADFPLGLPLRAGEQTEVPLDLSISFADFPGLVNVAREAARGGPVAFQLDGTVGVDAGRLGEPVFGPMTLLSGELRARVGGQ